eukprot:scaffold23_cov101-Skeletonema_dohrnii-CCMP3373.AAC.6
METAVGQQYKYISIGWSAFIHYRVTSVPCALTNCLQSVNSIRYKGHPRRHKSKKAIPKPPSDPKSPPFAVETIEKQNTAQTPFKRECERTYALPPPTSSKETSEEKQWIRRSRKQWRFMRGNEREVEHSLHCACFCAALTAYFPIFPFPPSSFWSVISRFGLTINNFDFCALQ